MAITHSEAARRLSAARTALLLDEPFFGALALRLRLREDRSCDTAWVDGRTFGYNPEFVMSCSAAELKGLVAHEVMHCAAGHPWRRGGRDNERWNEAADRVINPVLREAGFTLPEGALMEYEPTHHGKSAEWVYDRLPSPPPSNSGGESSDESDEDGDEGEDSSGSGGGSDSGEKDGNGESSDDSSAPSQDGASSDPSQGKPNGSEPNGSEPKESKSNQPSGDGADGADDSSKGGSGGGSPQPNRLGEVRDAPASGAADEGEAEDGPAPTEEEWQQAVQQAAVLSKGQGSVPAGLKRFIEESAQPRVDWRSALRRFVQEVARSDYSFARPNARYVAHGAYLPALYSHEVGVLAIAVDTSGSIDQVLLGQFAAEVRTLVDEVKPRQVRVMYADTRVYRQDVFERDDVVTLDARGGGGTDFRPVFTEIAKWDEAPVAVVYLTDLWGTFPTPAPDVPVLWVTGEKQAYVPPVPFGEVVAAG